MAQEGRATTGMFEALFRGMRDLRKCLRMWIRKLRDVGKVRWGEISIIAAFMQAGGEMLGWWG